MRITVKVKDISIKVEDEAYVKSGFLVEYNTEVIRLVKEVCAEAKMLLEERNKN